MYLYRQCVHAHTHAPHNTDRTSCKLPAAVKAHPSIYTVKCNLNIYVLCTFNFVSTKFSTTLNMFEYMKELVTQICEQIYQNHLNGHTNKDTCFTNI